MEEAPIAAGSLEASVSHLRANNKESRMTIRQKMIGEIALCTLGFGLLWYATDWVAALGMFFAMFGNNIGQSKD